MGVFLGMQSTILDTAATAREAMSSSRPDYHCIDQMGIICEIKNRNCVKKEILVFMRTRWAWAQNKCAIQPHQAQSSDVRKGGAIYALVQEPARTAVNMSNNIVYTMIHGGALHQHSSKPDNVRPNVRQRCATRKGTPSMAHLRFGCHQPDLISTCRFSSSSRYSGEHLKTASIPDNFNFSVIETKEEP